MRIEFTISKESNDYSPSSIEIQNSLSLDNTLVFMNGVLLRESEYEIKANIITIKSCPSGIITIFQ